MAYMHFFQLQRIILLSIGRNLQVLSCTLTDHFYHQADNVLCYDTTVYALRYSHYFVFFLTVHISPFNIFNPTLFLLFTKQYGQPSHSEIISHGLPTYLQFNTICWHRSHDYCIAIYGAGTNKYNGGRDVCSGIPVGSKTNYLR